MGSAAIQTVVVTSVVGETTTICPVAQASSVSSQVVASMSSAVVTTFGELRSHEKGPRVSFTDGLFY
jgi:hypothetical protein